MGNLPRGKPYCGASQVAPAVKNSPANAGDIRDAGSIPGGGDPMEESVKPYFSILAWRITWDRTARWATVHRAAMSRHDCSNLAYAHTNQITFCQPHADRMEVEGEDLPLPRKLLMCCVFHSTPPITKPEWKHLLPTQIQSHEEGLKTNIQRA